jgi:hypothetical protein
MTTQMFDETLAEYQQCTWFASETLSDMLLEISNPFNVIEMET